MKKYNVKQIEEMNSTDLRKVAAELGIANYTKYKKTDLLVEVLKVLEVKPDKQVPTKDENIDAELVILTKAGTPTLAKEEWKVLLAGDGTNSSKIRDLYDGGFRKATIAKVLEVRPQMVHNVINNYNEQKVLQSNVGGSPEGK